MKRRNFVLSQNEFQKYAQYMLTKEYEIKIEKIAESRYEPLDINQMGFGKSFSDHMVEMDYIDGEWKTPVIRPYGPINMEPSLSVMHYGQAVYEGMKAFRKADGEVCLFRPDMNVKRLNVSAERICIPTIPEDLQLQLLEKLISLDQQWVPDQDGGSLYIRPFIIGADNFIGLRPASTYKFLIITCPVGKYFAKPVNVKIEEEYTRAATGGTGYAKTPGNYAASLLPTKLGQEQGYEQLIWTDAKEHKYIEEAGSMNLCFMKGGKLITPKSSDTILAGITRQSVCDVARSWGIEVEERTVSVEEVVEGLRDGSVTDAFGAGTAATIAPIASVTYRGEKLDLPEERTVSDKIKKYFLELRRGKIEDPFGWMVPVK